MKISYDFGHMEGGQDTSANGIVYEYAEIRKYGPVCIDVLQKAGHTCINCTPPDNSGMTLNQSLAYRTEKANSSGSQLHLCFHVNAFDGSAHGAEVEVASDAGERYAEAILDEICKLGFTRRGINRPSLYVTRHTNMTAVLIEPFFCDSSVDCNKYNPVSLGNAIAKGILNVIGGNYSPATSQAQNNSSASKNNSSSQYDIKYLQHELNVQTGAGLVEDGIVGPCTKAAASKVIVKQGSQGNITRWVQAHVGTDADGCFGPNTSNVVKTFQRNHGLSADGIVGPMTWTALLG